MHVAAKVLLSLVLLGTSLWGGKRALVGLRRHLSRMERSFDAEEEESKCEECLTQGSDFCIGENRCTERATLTCDGPEDHITGDLEFSLHGNPDAIHSMVCPGSKSKETRPEVHEHGWGACRVAKTRCMHDGERVTGGRCGLAWGKCEGEIEAHGWRACAAAKQRCLKNGEKVMEGRCGFAWKKCGAEIKEHAWDACSAAKIRCTKDGEKVLKGRCGHAWDECGKKHKVHATHQDCYFDKECHEKVDWKEVAKIKPGFFARLKYFKEKEDVKGVKNMLSNVHSMFAKFGMPEDRIDYILHKWVKSAYPDFFKKEDQSEEDEEEEEEEDEDDEEKEMQTSEECSKYESLGPMAVRGCEGCAKWYEGRVDQCMGCGKQCAAHCPPGSPFDCYHEEPFVSCHKECMGKKSVAVDKKDCYFDEACHKKVDWRQIKKLKKGIFARLKFYKEKNDGEAVKLMLSRVRPMFEKAGMPEDRIEYILYKWVRSVYPGFFTDYVVKKEDKEHMINKPTKDFLTV